MSDQVEQPQAGAEQEGSQVEQPAVEADEFDKDRALETIKKLREFEKESKRLAKKVSEYEAAEQKRKEAEMSETDKLKAQLEKATKDLQSYQLNELKRQAAAKHGLPDALALRLQGDDLESLEADAEALAKTLPKVTAPKLGATNPGAAPGKRTDEELMREVFGHSANIFDPSAAGKSGGGVIYHQQEE